VRVLQLLVECVIGVFDYKRNEKHDGGLPCTLLIDGGDGRDLLSGTHISR